MKKEIKFFQKGLFEKPFMNSRIKAQEMTWKEIIFGFLVGPFGMAALISVIGQLAELYYTEIFYIDRIFGTGTYLVMSWVVKITGIAAGFVIAYIIERSVSSQGKMRPLILIGSVVSAISGFFLFYIPDMPDVMRLVWVYVFNILYNSIGVTLFNLKNSLLTLSTRNQSDRNQINVISNISSYLLVGTAVTLVVGSVLYYTFLHGFPWQNWALLVGVLAAVSLPLSFIHYYYTKERITLENMTAEESEEALGEIAESKVNFSEENKHSVKKQLFALFHCKYWILAILITMLIGITNSISGFNLATNFCTVILGATAENQYNLMYTVASGVPLGIGVLVMYPISKKITIRKTTMLFSCFAILGSVFGLIVKSRFIPVVIANFIYNFGILPTIYIIGALVNAANDEVEYKFGFRPEGTIAVAIVACITGIITGAFAGVYETGLSAAGHDPALGTAQPQGVLNWLYFVRYIVPILEHVLMILVLYFMNLESKLPKMQEEIKARHEK